METGGEYRRVNISKTPDKSYYRTDETITVSVDNTLTETHRLAGWTLVNATRESGSAVSADDGELTNSITVTLSDNATVTAEFEPLLALINTSSQGNIIYYATNASGETYLSLGTYGDEITFDNIKSTVAYFKFGSLVGMDGDPTHTVFNSNLSTLNNAVKFNTMQTPISSWGSIPYQQVVVSPINTLSMVRKGLGDPCALLGLSSEEIAKLTTQEEFELALLNRPKSYQKWRTPTNLEWEAFNGNRAGIASWDDAIVTPWGQWDGDSDSGAYFVQHDVYLPTLHRRIGNMTHTHEFQYWSNHMASNAWGWWAYFFGAIRNTSGYSNTVGVDVNNVTNTTMWSFGVRCVRDLTLAF